MTMSTSSAPSSTALRVSATLSSVGDWPDGKAVATEATFTTVPRVLSTAVGTRFGYTQIAATEGTSGSEGSWHRELGRYRSDFAFRGEAAAGPELVTSLTRLGGDYAGVEQHLLRNFRRYARREAVPEDTVWNWLAVGKHHGLPTRLLDWS